MTLKLNSHLKSIQVIGTPFIFSSWRHLPTPILTPFYGLARPNEKKMASSYSSSVFSALLMGNFLAFGMGMRRLLHRQGSSSLYPRRGGADIPPNGGICFRDVNLCRPTGNLIQQGNTHTHANSHLHIRLHSCIHLSLNCFSYNTL